MATNNEFLIHWPQTLQRNLQKYFLFTAATEDSWCHRLNIKLNPILGATDEAWKQEDIFSLDFFLSDLHL